MTAVVLPFPAAQRVSRNMDDALLNDYDVQFVRGVIQRLYASEPAITVQVCCDAAVDAMRYEQASFHEALEVASETLRVMRLYSSEVPNNGQR